MIDTRDYDLATLYRFKLFFENTHWFNRPNIPITEIRNNHIYEGKRIEFPLIALRRVSTPIMYKDAHNSWARGITGDRRGRDITIAPDGRTSSVDMTMVQTNYELKYLLEVFSFERDNFDELVIEIQENLFRYPYLTFENWKDKDLRMPDPQVAGMSTNITWESTEDNTDLESFDSQTPFYRASITFTVRAYIYRKYAALLLEEVLNGYRILDYNKFTQQVVLDGEQSIEGGAGPSPAPPGPGPAAGDITTDNIASFDAIGSIGIFLYTEPGSAKQYGSEVAGRFLVPVSMNVPTSGAFLYSDYRDETLTGTWKLLSPAGERSYISPSLVMAVKVGEEKDSLADAAPKSRMASFRELAEEDEVVTDGTPITVEGIAEIDMVGSIGMFLWSGGGDQPYGAAVDGSMLHPVAFNASISGEVTYSHYRYIPLTGTWKLMSPAHQGTATNPAIVFAVKVKDAENGRRTRIVTSVRAVEPASPIMDTLEPPVQPQQQDKGAGEQKGAVQETAPEEDQAPESALSPVREIQEMPTAQSDAELSVVKDTQEEEPPLTAWFSISHGDIDIKLNILITGERKYIYYDRDKEYTVSSVCTSTGRKLQDPLGVIRLVDYDGKLALDTGGITLTAAYVEYREAYKPVEATDMFSL